MKNLDDIAEQVIGLLVSTFDFPEAEARRRLDLWRLEQHNLEGGALEAILPKMTDEERAAEVLRYLLQGEDLAKRLEGSQPRAGPE